MFNYNLFLQRLSNSKLSKQSFIKNEIAQRLLMRLDLLKITPNNILVTGYTDKDYIRLLNSRFPDSKIFFKNNDSYFDLIISNSIIHMTYSIDDEITSYYKKLNNDGILIFSTIGNKSFKTLNKCFDSLDTKPHTNQFIDLLTWGNTLQASQLKNTVIESEIITFTYKKIKTLFSDIRDLNEPLADTKMHKGLTGKNKWKLFKIELIKHLQLEIEAL